MPIFELAAVELFVYGWCQSCDLDRDIEHPEIDTVRPDKIYAQFSSPMAIESSVDTDRAAFTSKSTSYGHNVVRSITFLGQLRLSNPWRSSFIRTLGTTTPQSVIFGVILFPRRRWRLLIHGGTSWAHLGAVAILSGMYKSVQTSLKKSDEPTATQVAHKASGLSGSSIL